MAEPKVAQNKPFVMKIVRRTPFVTDIPLGGEPGIYAWCACGESDSQPYCHGSHKGSEFKPVIELAEETKRMGWCGCKHSDNALFCDGTHATL